MKIRIYILLFSFSIGILQAQHSFSVVEDVLWSSPKGFDLTMDIYTPEMGKEDYPVIVMYHGGGMVDKQQQHHGPKCPVFGPIR